MKTRIVLLAAAILLILFALRPGASRLKSRIIYSMSSAIARPVDIGSVHVRLLPRPGFDLENLVVYDDPSFGAEPILRCSEVTALLRITSLFRGRIEIARLDLTDPSLNLVHAANGRWNLEALLERTAHLPLAPTSKAKSEARPGFPYIEASSARINLKSGPEKKPYALTNADFSLWQDSENTWGIRLKAQPFRTDFNLNDTGLLQVSGTWQRAGTLRETPMQLNIEWTRGQLGQVTKFFTGNDQGWRGSAQLDLNLKGTPENLQVDSALSVVDFRRYDITTGDPLRLAVRCIAQYRSPQHKFHEIACDAPVGAGFVTVKGDVTLFGSRDYDLVVTAENVPATSALALAKRAKKNLPDDLVAEGTILGKFFLARNSSQQQSRVEGQGEISELRLNSASNKAQIGPETVSFSLTDAPSKLVTRKQARAALPEPEGPRLKFGPLFLASARNSSPAVLGWLNRAGYSFSVAAEADIARTLHNARLFGISSLQANVEGTAQLDLRIAGSWTGLSSGPSNPLSAPQVTGSAKLRNVHIAIRGAAAPIEIASAEMQLASDAVRISRISAKAADGSWTGSFSLPRGCGTPGACQLHFDLSAGKLSLIALRDWISPHPKDRPWYQVLASDSSPTPSLFSNLQASGHIGAQALQLNNATASNVSADVVLDHGTLRIDDLNADVLGGKHHGEWQAELASKPGVCHGKGSLTGVSLAQIARSPQDAEISGSANASYDIKGDCPADFWATAQGSLQFDVREGTLPHIFLAAPDQPLHVSRLKGDAQLKATTLEFKNANLDSSAGKFQVSGTASLTREINLKLTRPANKSGGYSITGTLSEPRVEPSPAAEQARLKP